MFRSPHRLLIGAVLLSVWVSRAPAQDEKPPKDEPKQDQPKKDKDEPKKGGGGVKVEPSKPAEEYRDFFKKPETVAELWRAMQFEIEVGRFDLAARHLRGLVDKKPDEKDLLDLVDKQGMSAFLRLRNIDKWGNEKETAQARKDVEALISQVSAAYKKQLNDPERIARFVRNLNATPEERDYAVKELYRTGAAAVPYLVEALQSATGDERANLMYALQRLGPDAVPPLLAALDVNDPVTQYALIDVVQKRKDLPSLRQRAETDPAPWWWPLTASTNPTVRQKAAEALGTLLDLPPSKLPPAKQALTREAERYYRHQVKFLDPGAVTIWRWDNKQLVPGWPGVAAVSTSKAEEYYGLRFARQALALDPSYEPAQVVFLSLALEKGMERAGLDQPLAKAAPEVHDLLATVNPDLVIGVLDRALTDHNLPVILGSLRVLGELAESRATRPTGHGEGAVVRALYYPDRRIQFATVETLLRASAALNRSLAGTAAARVVEILRRAVVAEPAVRGKAKVLLGLANADALQASSQALEKAGFEVVSVQTGRDGLRRLRDAADIDLVLIDADLPDPGLSSLLGQLRADVNTGLLPVVVLVAPEREEHLRRATERYRNVQLAPPSLAVDDGNLKKILPVLIAEAIGQPLGEAQLKEYAERSVLWLGRMARGELPGYDVQPAGDTVLTALRAGKLSPEAQLAAIDVVGRLPGAKPQDELAQVVLDANRPAPVRNAAALELVRHIQQHTGALPAGQVKSLESLAANKDTDATLRGNVVLIMGSLRPDAQRTADRLKDFRPPTPAPAPAPKEK